MGLKGGARAMGGQAWKGKSSGCAGKAGPGSGSFRLSRAGGWGGEGPADGCGVCTQVQGGPLRGLGAGIWDYKSGRVGQRD